KSVVVDGSVRADTRCGALARGSSKARHRAHVSRRGPLGIDRARRTRGRQPNPARSRRATERTVARHWSGSARGAGVDVAGGLVVPLAASSPTRTGTARVVGPRGGA